MQKNKTISTRIFKHFGLFLEGFWSEFHVLRTYRRAAGGERKAQVKPNKGFMQQLMHYVEQASVRKNHGVQRVTARRRRSQTYCW